MNQTDTIIVVKFGGNAMTSPELTTAFARNLVGLRDHGIAPIVVHGGGPQVSAMLQKLGIDSEFKGGLRVTTPETIDVVYMVLHGLVGRDVVGHINQVEPVAVGLSGADGGLMKAQRRYAHVDGTAIDVGQVGDVADVDPALLHQLLDSGLIPVISPLAPDADGLIHNLNADTAAAAIASALKADKLVVLTDVAGLYANWPDETSLISQIDTDQLTHLLPTLSAGMIPKIEGCVRAVEAGVPQAHIIDGRNRDALAQLVTGTIPGTTITAPQEAESE